MLVTFKIILLLNVISVAPSLIGLCGLRELIKRSLKYTTSLELSPKRRATYVGFELRPVLIKAGFNLSLRLTVLSHL